MEILKIIFQVMGVIILFLIFCIVFISLICKSEEWFYYLEHKYKFKKRRNDGK
jgi:Na+-transporting methylmalonyl-CoA/oxaloacetate decarboxylase gamma subunit